jgi:hypothetical protein
MLVLLQVQHNRLLGYIYIYIYICITGRFGMVVLAVTFEAFHFCMVTP